MDIIMLKILPIAFLQSLLTILMHMLYLHDMSYVTHYL